MRGFTAPLLAALGGWASAGSVPSTCWDGGYGPAFCCGGRGGRAECWDAVHSFERCCTEYLNETQPFSDLLVARSGRGALLSELGSWSGAAAAERRVVQVHRRCAAASGEAARAADCAALEVLAAEEAAWAPVGSQYVGLQHRLVLRQYPFSYFVAPVHDNFYKAKVFPWHYWGSDDFALFEAGFRALLSCGDVAVDAGANIGGYTQLLAHSVCASGRVHSFEPFRLTFQMLNANVALAGLVNVHTYHKALSNTASRSRAIGSDVRDPRQQTIWNSLVIPRSVVLQNENGMLWTDHESEDEEIEHITLDSLHLPQLDFIKIDVEAMEGHVLLGGLETIQRFHPSILVEVKGFHRQKIHSFLVKDLGYDCYSALSTNPSDFFCVHPRRRGDERAGRARQLWTTELAFDLCAACRRRGRAPLEVEVDLDMRIDAAGNGGRTDATGASGLVFDIEAKDVAVTITALTVGHHSIPAQFEIWAARVPGSQVKIVLTQPKWERVAAGSYEGSARTPHAIQLSPPVRVEARTRRAIYIFAGGSLQSRLVAGTAGGVSAEDDSIIVHSGDCGRPEPWRRFGVQNYELAGSVRYMQVQ